MDLDEFWSNELNENDHNIPKWIILLSDSKSILFFMNKPFNMINTILYFCMGYINIILIVKLACLF